MKTYAFVFARGGSKGVPGKNTRDLAGRPLLAHSIQLALEISTVEKVFVSTDDADIANVARKYGAEVIDRPEELALDDSPEWKAWQHAVKWVYESGDSFEVFLCLPTTSPLRNRNDVNQCLKTLDEGIDIVVTLTDTNRSPWFNMVKRESDGSYNLLLGGNEHIKRRQESPTIYDMTTVAYVTRPAFILNNDKIWDGKVGGVVVPPKRAIDIDTEFDLLIANFLFQK